MADKRGRDWQDGSRDGRPFQKKQKPNDIHQDRQQKHRHGQNYSSQKHGQNGSYRPSNSGPPGQAPRTKPVDPKFVLKDLLEQVLTSNAAWTSHDQNIIHHAKELYNLLYNQPSPPRIPLLLPDLNLKAPETSPYVTFTAYRANQPIKERKTLPTLPPIRESYLEDATFRHPSVHTSSKDKPEELNYERLEFLGDAYIEIISTRLIYSRFPNLTAGQQAQLRESLVKNETLAQYSEAYGFGNRISHTGDPQFSKAWTKILADVFEAYVAAIVLSNPENGFQTAETWMTDLWAPKLLEEPEPPIINADAKSEMYRKLGAKGVKLDYKEERDMEVDRSTGRQKYFIGLWLTGWGYEEQWLGSGEGQNKSQAGTMAAMDAFERSKEIIEDCNKKKIEVVARKKEEDAKKVDSGQTENGAVKDDDGKKDATKKKR